MNQALLLSKNIDRQLVYSGIDWKQFKLIQSGFAEASGIRLAYFNSISFHKCRANQSN